MLKGTVAKHIYIFFPFCKAKKKVRKIISISECGTIVNRGARTQPSLIWAEPKARHERKVIRPILSSASDPCVALH